MKNLELVTKGLSEKGLYPVPNDSPDGIEMKIDGQTVTIAASSEDLIELGNLLVSLALSGENMGQHWHTERFHLMRDDSDCVQKINHFPLFFKKAGRRACLFIVYDILRQ